MVYCSKCGRLIWRGQAVECASCFRPFHAKCMRRVKLEHRMHSYHICDECFAQKPMPNRRMLHARRPY